MKEDEVQLQRLSDRLGTRVRMDTMAQIGIGMFEHTPLVTETGEIGDEECYQAREYLLQAMPVTAENYRLHAHLLTTAEIGKRLALALKAHDPEGYKDLDPHEQYITGIFHDLGKYATNFKYAREEFATRILLERMGMRSSIIENLPVDAVDFHHANSKEKERALRDSLFHGGRFTAKGIATMADIYGKRITHGWYIQPFLGEEGVLQYHYNSRNKLSAARSKSMYPSGRILDEHLITLSGAIYEELDSLFKENGIDPATIQQQVMDDEAAAPVTTVVFDAGNVLVNNPDPDIMQNMSRTLNVDIEKVRAAFTKTVLPLQLGLLDTETFYQNFAAELNIVLPDGYQTLLTDMWDARIDPQMQKIIVSLREKNIRLAIHTDTIQAHRDTLEHSGGYGGIQQVISSTDIHVSKKGTDKDPLAAFGCVTVMLGGNPHALVFVDDKLDYIEKANQVGMHGIHFISADALESKLFRYLHDSDTGKGDVSSAGLIATSPDNTQPD